MGRVLVTGGTGFIGGALIAAIRDHHEVVALSRADGDVAEPATFRGLERVDHVFHLASRTFVPDSWMEPGDFLSTNVTGTANVADYCRRVAAPLTYVSAYVYGKPERLPIREDDRVAPNNPYALSKHLAERVCEFFARFRGVRVCVVRPFNVYGPGQPAHFVIPTIIAQMRRGDRIVLKDLTPKRDYLYVDDLVDLLRRTMTDSGEPFTVVNAGSGASVSLVELLERLQRIAGTALPVESAEQRRYEELDEVRADIARAGRLFAWAPRVALDEGLRRTLAGA